MCLHLQAIHAKRVTIMPKDIILALRLRGGDMFDLHNKSRGQRAMAMHSAAASMGKTPRSFAARLRGART